MLADGTYKRATRASGEEPVNSQEVLLGKAAGKKKKSKLTW